MFKTPPYHLQSTIAFIVLVMILTAISCNDQNRRKREAYDAYNRGVRAVRANNLDLAGFHFRRAVILHPEFSEARLNLANIYFLNGNMDGARDEYGKLLEQKCRDPRIWFNLGWIYLAQDDYETAHDCFTKSRQQSVEFPDSDYGLAMLARAEGKDVLAKFHLENYLQNDPNGRWSEKAQAILASMNPDETTLEDPAEQSSETAIIQPEVLPESSIDNSILEDENSLIKQQESTEIPVEPAPDTSETEPVTIKPDTTPKITESVSDSEKTSSTEKPVSQLISEGLSALKSDDLVTAERRLKDALKKNKNSKEAVLGLARLYYIKNDESSERKYVKEIVRISGKDSKDNFYLALGYEEVGDIYSAIREYRKYLTENPFGPNADDAKKNLTELDKSNKDQD